MEICEPQTLEFAEGHLSEIVAPRPSSGIPLVILELLAEKRDLPLVLVDSGDGFDPASYGNAFCRRLLWIRCDRTGQALQCVDLLLRDGNLPLVLLDLHLVCERELRQLPAALWHRLKTQARDSGTALVAMTPRPLIPSPQRRLVLGSRFSLDHLELESPALRFQSPGEQALVNKA